MNYYIADFNNLSNLTDSEIMLHINKTAIRKNYYYTHANKNAKELKWHPISEHKYLLVTEFYIHELTSDMNNWDIYYCFNQITEEIFKLAQTEHSFTVWELLTIAEKGVTDDGFSRDGCVVIPLDNLIKIAKRSEKNG